MARGAKDTLVAAAEAGDRLAEVRVMHRIVAAAVADPETPTRDLAALTRRQLELGRELGGDRLDEWRSMRVIVAAAIEGEKTAPRDLAALTRRQLEIGREIEGAEAERQAKEEAARGEAVPDEPLDPSTL